MFKIPKCILKSSRIRMISLWGRVTQSKSKTHLRSEEEEPWNWKEVENCNETEFLMT